jgi:hypothetical protein
MSFLVNEIETLLYRVIVMSDHEAQLKSCFQDISMEFTTDLQSSKHRLDWKACVFPRPSTFQYFCAATLGLRGQLSCRMHFAGHVVGKKPVDLHSLCENADILFLDLDSNRESSANFISQFTQNISTACVLRGLHDDNPLPSSQLRHKALVKWSLEKFSKLYLLKESDKILQRSLEWALSFS